jgi:cytochrome c oxidase assembly protein subunit 15
MAKIQADRRLRISSVHRSLLVEAAIFTVLLIAMGGVLCVTQSIRNCPDWPGCFGRIIPPAEPGPILEYIHRFLAGVSSLLIVSTAIIGIIRVPRLRWLSIPPLVAIALLVEVSFFGAQVVLHGLAPGWAAVDGGSALLVVALMISVAVRANMFHAEGSMSERLSFNTPFSRLALATLAVIYGVLVSGILVTGKGSLTGCLGWPIYSPQQLRLDGYTIPAALRLILSVIGGGMLVAVLVQAWHVKQEHPQVFKFAWWVGAAFASEILLQVLLLVFGLPIVLLVIYTLVMAVLWGLLVALVVRLGVPAA